MRKKALFDSSSYLNPVHHQNQLRECLIRGLSREIQVFFYSRSCLSPGMARLMVGVIWSHMQSVNRGPAKFHLA